MNPHRNNHIHLRVLVTLLTACLWLNSGMADATDADNFDHSHGLWNAVLQTSVAETPSSSKVRYADLKAHPEKFDRYLQNLSAVSQKQFAAWNKNEKLSFLINAYNALTVKLVIDHYPVESIKDIGSFFRNSWKIPFFTLLGEEMFLDHIEHKLIRGADDFSEPRIHFALVCASVGCPKLQAQAFTANRLDEMLEQGAKAFLQDTTRNYYDAKKQVLNLSSLFKWYGEDFDKLYGSMTGFVVKYITQDAGQQTAIARDIADNTIDVEYLDYDWSLNDAK